MRVLVVDDNATNRQILVKMLEGWRMVPTVSESGAKAMVTLTEAKGIGRTFPLILLDAQMPEMDGFALAEYIKRHPSFRAATIMMLSSAGQRGDAMRCRELGVAAYLTKPIRQSELMDAILTALGTRAKTEAKPALVTRHSLREGKHHLRVLLAEDNVVNQLVALRLLETLRAHGDSRGEREKGAGGFGKGSVRRDFDGRSNARDERLGSDPSDPGKREGNRRTHSDYRHDRARDEGRRRDGVSPLAWMIT